jgi:multicomponent Na+:H+ antiporter subunit E
MVKRGSQSIGFALAFIVWLTLNWKIDAVTLSLGLAFSLLASMFFGELITVTPERAIHIHRYFWAIYYVPVFLWQMFKSNIDVAFRVLHPDLPIDPGLIKIRTKLKSEVSRAFLANSLSLTPGSTTVDIIGDEIYVHCIDVNRPVREEAALFEKIIARMFE